MPTLITDIPEKIDLAIAAVSKAGPDILGLHLEGPFINPERKGIHAESAIRDFDPALPKKIEKLAHERKVMITLAPECVPRSFIQDLSDAGAIVCAGHTKATLAQLSPLLGVPIKGITHLFNAMTGHHREPACIGAGLMTDQVWCSIIGDGHHVHPLTIALAARSKPAGKLFFVSDAMAVLEDQGSFKLGNRLIRIEKGHCFDANGRLAGAARPLSYALKTATQKVHLGLVEALRMITLYPANFLELKNKGRIAPGYDDDLVRIGQDLNVKDLMHQSRHAKRVSGL